MEKKIQYLLSESLVKGKLDPQKIMTIAGILNKGELKLYYKLLKKKRKEEIITVLCPITLPSSVVKQLRKLFAGKDLLLQKDASLIAGYMVLFSDFVFDASFKNYLGKIQHSYEVN